MFKQVMDAHIHLDLYQEKERSDLLHDLETDGVDALINVSYHLASSQENLQLARTDRRIKPAFGFHPEQPLPDDADLSAILEFIGRNQQEMVAIGEIGLPYYLRQEDSSIDRDEYLDLLEAFIEQACAMSKPVVLHAVYDDAPVVCDLLEKYSISRAHFHWFKGDRKTIDRLIGNNYFISITPDVLYEREIQQLVEMYPLSLMMVETDGPWKFKGHFAGKMTHPRMIHQSVAKIAELKRMPLGEVYVRLYENTRRFYEIKK